MIFKVCLDYTLFAWYSDTAITFLNYFSIFFAGLKYNSSLIFYSIFQLGVYFSAEIVFIYKNIQQFFAAMLNTPLWN